MAANALLFNSLASTAFLRSDITNAAGTITNLNTSYLAVSGSTTITGQLQATHTVQPSGGGAWPVFFQNGYVFDSPFDGQTVAGAYASSTYGIGLIGQGQQVGVYGSGKYGGEFRGLGAGNVGVYADAIGDGSYGLKVNNDSAGGYSVYSTGGLNYFGGNVGIGTTTMTEKLTIEGNANITGTTTASCFTIDGVTCLASGGEPLYIAASSSLVHYGASTTDWNTAYGWGSWLTGLLGGHPAVFSNATTTNATTTNLAITGMANTYLAVNGLGQVIATTTPTGGTGDTLWSQVSDYLTPLTSTLGLTINGTTTLNNDFRVTRLASAFKMNAVPLAYDDGTGLMDYKANIFGGDEGTFVMDPTPATIVGISISTEPVTISSADGITNWGVALVNMGDGIGLTIYFKDSDFADKAAFDTAFSVTSSYFAKSVWVATGNSDYTYAGALTEVAGYNTPAFTYTATTNNTLAIDSATGISTFTGQTIMPLGSYFGDADGASLTITTGWVGIPVLKGQLFYGDGFIEGTGIKRAAYVLEGTAGGQGGDPSLIFISNDGDSQAGIAYSTSTGLMEFQNSSKNVSGSYSFDGDVGVTGTVRATCFTTDGITCLTGGAVVVAIHSGPLRRKLFIQLFSLSRLPVTRLLSVIPLRPRIRFLKLME